MVLKVFGHPKSRPTLRVIHALKEKEVPFEFVAINVADKEHKTPEYLKNQPFGLIPYIADDGFVLYESRAISKYIATKWQNQGARLLPDLNDMKAVALFDQALSVEHSNFDPAATEILVEKFFKPKILNQQPDETVAAASIAKLSEKLDGYEAILSKQRYLCGEILTLADTHHLALGSLLVEDAGVPLLTDDTKHPNVARWWKDISSRPAWVSVKNGI